MLRLQRCFLWKVVGLETNQRLLELDLVWIQTELGRCCPSQMLLNVIKSELMLHANKKVSNQ